MSRTCFGLGLALASTAVICGFVTPAFAISPGTITIGLNLFATIPAADGTPQDIVSAGDGTGRLFVTTRNGKIDILNANGTLQSTPFLNMTAPVGSGGAGLSIFTTGEGGLFGLAFSPNYPSDGKFFTYQTEPFSTSNPPADFSQSELRPTTTINPADQITIRQWTVSAANPNLANPSSPSVLVRINHAIDTNHQGGSLKFGPDRFLYAGVGDGGGGNDIANGRTSSDLTDGHNNPVGNGQDLTTAMGKILRIDPLRVDPSGINSANGLYAIPSTNPFAGDATKVREIFAYGMRNPFRMSFDNATGKLWLGDVGQVNREEVDNIVSGGNFGWPFREGTRDNSADAGRTTPLGFTSLAPVAEYTHADGNAIMGGFVYHGSLIPQLSGKYIFGDLAGTAGTGRLFYMDVGGGTISELKYQTGGSFTTPTGQLYGFGQNDAGELYAFFSNGRILALVPEPSSITLAALATIAVPLLLRKRDEQIC